MKVCVCRVVNLTLVLTYFTPFSKVSIAEFLHVNFCWDVKFLACAYSKNEVVSAISK